MVSRLDLREDLKLVRSGSCGFLEKSIPDGGSRMCKSPEAQRWAVSKKSGRLPSSEHSEKGRK